MFKCFERESKNTPLSRGSKALEDILRVNAEVEYELKSLYRRVDTIEADLSPDKLEGVVMVCIKNLLQYHNLTVVTKCQEKEYYSELITSEVEELEQKERELKEALENVNKALKKVKN